MYLEGMTPDFLMSPQKVPYFARFFLVSPFLLFAIPKYVFKKNVCADNIISFFEVRGKYSKHTIIRQTATQNTCLKHARW